MKISIIIPIYNVESYVAHCIQSVMDQTYEGSIECLLVDDCGNDNSMGIVEDMLGDYEGPIEFKVLHHEHNRGLSAARNSGTEEASGDYVFFLDSDDAISVDCIALMVEVVSNHPEVEVVQGAMESIPYNKYYDLELCKTPRFVDDNDWVRYNAYKYGERLPVNATNKLLKKSFLTGNGLTFKEGITNEDELWSFQIACTAKTMAVVGRETYVYKLREGSITVNAFTSFRVNCLMTVLGEMYRFAEVRKLLRNQDVHNIIENFRIGCLSKIQHNTPEQLEVFYQEQRRVAPSQWGRCCRLNGFDFKKQVRDLHLALPVGLALLYLRLLLWYYLKLSAQ